MTQHALAAPPPNLVAFSSLAERLRDGPLRTIAALQARAAALAAAAAEGDQERLAELGELVHLAQTAMLQFHEFTRELTTLVAELAAREPRTH